MSGLLVVNEVNQSIQKSELRIGILAFAGDSWATNQGIIGPEYQRIRIEQEKFFLHTTNVNFWAKNRGAKFIK